VAASGATATVQVRHLQGNGHGPAVPGLQPAGATIDGQQDVDALLAALGM
jgi:hypothetical protein